MSEFAFEMEGICKTFSNNTVLDKVDFRVKTGEVHALVGGNGAGKSTLMKILTGVYKSDAGSIKVDGVVTKLSTPNDATENGIRIIFQELSLVPTLTVMENIFLNHEKMKNGMFLDRNAMREKAIGLLGELEIDVDIDTRVSELGVGYCQLIEIAKALSINAKILVMDEPTASLSESETATLFRLIGKLKTKGVSIVYISHRMQEIFRVADSITVLRNGQRVLTSGIEAMTLESVIENMMGGASKNAFQWRERETPHSEENIVELKDIHYGNILNGVSFSIKKGEILGIAGLMGSGKTEILEILFGMRRPSSGSIEFNGEPVTLSSPRAAIAHKVALVPEDRRRQGLVLIHSVRDNIILASLAWLSKFGLLSRKRANQMVDDGISELSIKTPHRQSVVKFLSGGNQQKVVISKWLKTNPDLMLLDEPTVGVDVKAKGEIIDIIRSFSESGRSVIFVSSELAELLVVCDRILVLRNGIVKDSLIRSEIESEEVLQHAIQQ